MIQIKDGEIPLLEHMPEDENLSPDMQAYLETQKLLVSAAQLLNMMDQLLIEYCQTMAVFAEGFNKIGIALEEHNSKRIVTND